MEALTTGGSRCCRVPHQEHIQRLHLVSGRYFNVDVSGRWIVGYADYALIDRGSRIVPCDVLWFWNRFRPTVLYSYVTERVAQGV